MSHLMHAQVERLRRARIFNMTGDGSEEGRNDAEDEAPECKMGRFASYFI